MTEKIPSRARKRALRGLLILLMLLCAGLAWWHHTYTIEDGCVLRRDARVVDRRGTELSAERFEALRSDFPEAEILWDVPLSGGAFPSDSVTVTPEHLAEDDIPLFGYFTRLETVDARSCRDYPALLALREAYPSVRVLWQVEIAGRSCPQDTASLTLPREEASAELAGRLAFLPELGSVRFTGGAVDASVQDALRAALPAVEFRCDTVLLGRELSCDSETISFTGEPLSPGDLAEIRDNAFRFPSLRQVDLTDCGLANADLWALDQALEGVEVLWTTEVYGVTVSSLDRELDLSDIQVRDGGAALDGVLPYLPRLEKVDMSRCGLSNERLDALNRRFETVRIVWTIYFSAFWVRTDDTYFICSKYVLWEAPLYSFQCDIFRYCPDLIALDLGQRQLTDISFLYYLPHLQYLILAVNEIRDISPIGALGELKYLELFQNKVEDLSPLLNCTALQDLNICYLWTPADSAFETLTRMPWLERLWYCGNGFSQEQKDALQASNPDCEMFLEPHAESTGGTWRYHQHYYDMRDVFEMGYMEGGIN